MKSSLPNIEELLTQEAFQGERPHTLRTPFSAEKEGNVYPERESFSQSVTELECTGWPCERPGYTTGGGAHTHSRHVYTATVSCGL